MLNIFCNRIPYNNRILLLKELGKFKRASWPNSFTQGRKQIKQCTGSSRVETRGQPSCPGLLPYGEVPTLRPPRERKKGASHVVTLCHCFWRLCFCIRALILLSFKEEKLALFNHKGDENDFSLICSENRQAGLNKRWDWSNAYFCVPSTSISHIPGVSPPSCRMSVLPLRTPPTGPKSRLSSTM